MSGRIACYIDVAVKTKNIPICSILQSTNQIKLQCYKQIAEKYNEPSICENVPGDNGGEITLIDFCYQSYSIDLNNLSTCNLIKNYEMKGGCFSKVALALNDPEICENIQDEIKKEICYESLGIFSGECAKEGEKFSRVYRDEYLVYCCECLTEWDSGFDTRISIADKCYDTMLASGYPVGTCINCGNGICENIENICNCPSDCLNTENSDYNNIEDFCNESYEGYCRNDLSEMELEMCKLCQSKIPQSNYTIYFVVGGLIVILIIAIIISVVFLKPKK